MSECVCCITIMFGLRVRYQTIFFAFFIFRFLFMPKAELTRMFEWPLSNRSMSTVFVWKKCFHPFHLLQLVKTRIINFSLSIWPCTLILVSGTWKSRKSCWLFVEDQLRFVPLLLLYISICACACIVNAVAIVNRFGRCYCWLFAHWVHCILVPSLSFLFFSQTNQ